MPQDEEVIPVSRSRPLDRDDAQQLNYEFVVNKDGHPTKLGDGTFGAVFKVISPGLERAAVKLFYPAVRRERDGYHATATKCAPAARFEKN